MEREWGNFLILSLFPPSLSISYFKICHKMLKKRAPLSRMSQKINILYEEITLGRIRCKEAPQVVRACLHRWMINIAIKMYCPSTYDWITLVKYHLRVFRGRACYNFHTKTPYILILIVVVVGFVF